MSSEVFKDGDKDGDYHAQKHDKGKTNPSSDPYLLLLFNGAFMLKVRRVGDRPGLAELLASIPSRYRDLGVANATHLGFLKYGKWNGWKDVPDALLRYKAAALRHYLFEKYYPEDAHDGMDTDSKEFIPGGVHHMSLAACNLAFVIELEAAQ